MIIFRKYGSVVEITKTQKEVSPVRRVLSTRKKCDYITVRRSDSLFRTKRILMRKLHVAIEKFGAPLLATLTFKGSASDLLLSTKRLSHFQRRLRIKFPNAISVFVPEISPKGRIHYHGFIFNVPKEWGDVKKGKITVSIGRERSERLFQKLWGYGYVDLIATDGSQRLATYLTKYVVKATNDSFFSPVRLIRSSRGFPKHIEVRDPLLTGILWDRYNLIKPDFSFSTYTSFFGLIQKRFYYNNKN